MPFINDMLNSIENKNNGDVSPEVNSKKKLQTRFKFDTVEIMQQLRKQVHGQEQALQSIECMLKIVRSDISDPEKPLYVGLFLGPTGVGKTETVKVLTEMIHGNRDQFCRVDMNTLSLDHYAAALVGAPPGYVGSKEGSTILDKNKVEGSFSKPGIVLFDEIEKASQQVIQTLLNVFDNGKMVIASGDKVIDFSNTIIFMTSNLGAREMSEYTNHILSSLKLKLGYYLNPIHWKKGNKGILEQIIEKNLNKTFQPEFLNRIDDIITFNWLERNTLYAITDTFLEQINKRLRKYNCELKIDDSARQFLIKVGYNKRFGVRAFKRALRQYIEVPLSELLIEQSAQDKFLTYIAQKEKDSSDITIVLS